MVFLLIIIIIIGCPIIGIFVLWIHRYKCQRWCSHGCGCGWRKSYVPYFLLVVLICGMILITFCHLSVDRFGTGTTQKTSPQAALPKWLSGFRYCDWFMEQPRVGVRSASRPWKCQMATGSTPSNSIGFYKLLSLLNGIEFDWIGRLDFVSYLAFCLTGHLQDVCLESNSPWPSSWGLLKNNLRLQYLDRECQWQGWDPLSIISWLQGGGLIWSLTFGPRNCRIEFWCVLCFVYGGTLL